MNIDKYPKNTYFFAIYFLKNIYFKVSLIHNTSVARSYRLFSLQNYQINARKKSIHLSTKQMYAFEVYENPSLCGGATLRQLSLLTGCLHRCSMPFQMSLFCCSYPKWKVSIFLPCFGRQYRTACRACNIHRMAVVFGPLLFICCMAVRLYRLFSCTPPAVVTNRRGRRGHGGHWSPERAGRTGRIGGSKR